MKSIKLSKSEISGLRCRVFQYKSNSQIKGDIYRKLSKAYKKEGFYEIHR